MQLWCLLACCFLRMGGTLPVVAAAPAWRHLDAITGTLPTPVRGEFSMVAWQGSLWVWGGCNLAFDVFYSDLWQGRVSQATVNWTSVDVTGDVPPGSCGHGSAVLGNDMFIFGGLVSASPGTTSNLYAVNMVTRVWRTIRPCSTTAFWPPPRALIQHSVVVVSNSSFIVVSGTSPDANDDDSAWQFDINSPCRHWSKASAGQAGTTEIGGSSAVLLSSPVNRLLVLGGYDQNISSVISNFIALNISAEFNSSRPPHYTSIQTSHRSGPGPIAFQGAAVISSLATTMLVWGGFNMTATHNELWAYESIANRWCLVDVNQNSLPPPHFAGGFVAIGNILYAFGGRIHPAGKHEELSSDLWMLDLSTSVVSRNHLCLAS